MCLSVVGRRHSCTCALQLTKLLNNSVELSEVGLVLALVLDLLLDTLENADGGGVVVDLARGAEGSGNNLSGRNEVVREGVVETTLELEEVGDLAKELAVAGVELLVRLLGLAGRVADRCGLVNTNKRGMEG